MYLFETLDVTLSIPASGQLHGATIDLPKPGAKAPGSAMEVAGWVLGRSAPAIAVELISDGRVIRRVPIRERRPDVTSAYPGAADSDIVGFRVILDLLGSRPDLHLWIQAVLADQARVPIGSIQAAATWQEEAERPDAPLVSVVIPCYNQAPFLGDAIESV